MIEAVEKMSMEEFVHLCNRLVSEMGFKIRKSVYRENIAVFDAYMPIPGKSLHYVIIFLRKPKVTKDEILELIDVESVEIKWMLITTGEFEKEDLGDDITLMDGKDFERLLEEFGLKEEFTRLERGKEAREGRYLPSAGELESMLQWAREFLNEENYEKAMEYVDKALKIKSTPEGMKIKARILQKMGKYEEAISVITKILEENVKDDEAWFIFGEILEDMGDLDEAEQAYGQCVHFNRLNVYCWINRGNVLLSQKKYQEALMCYDKALALNENLPAIWNNRGVALKYLGKYDEALKSYNTALQFDSKFADAHLNKAYLYFDLKKYEEARNALAGYLRLKEDARGYLLLANIFAKRNMKKDAIEAVKKALELEPGNQEARELLDRLEGRSRELRDYEEIKKILKEEIEKMNVREENAVKKIKSARENLERGNVANALKEIIEVREHAHSQNVAEIKEALYRNTQRLLELANMNVENLGELEPKELNALGLEAMKRVVLCSKEEEKNVEGYPRGYAHLLYEEKKWNELKKLNNEIAENSLGLRYFKARRYRNAEEYFKNAFFKSPDFYEAELNLAYTYLKNGKERKAKALLKHLGLEM
ncbi:tetratricopeptide repeat domain protein [Aciduliprofundum boonei T469]|nr:tetratricopeptide repeat domain protein [Aciduliprofundum boonei T469]